MKMKEITRITCNDWNCSYNCKSTGYCAKHTKKMGYKVLVAYNQLNELTERIAKDTVITVKGGKKGEISHMTQRRIENSKYSMNGLSLKNYECYLWCMKQPGATHMSHNGSNSVLLTDQEILNYEEEIESNDNHWGKRLSNCRSIISWKKPLIEIPEINIEAIHIGKELDSDRKSLERTLSDWNRAKEDQAQWEDSKWIEQMIDSKQKRTLNLQEEAEALENLISKKNVVLTYVTSTPAELRSNLKEEHSDESIGYSMFDLLFARLSRENGVPDEEE